MVAPWPYGSRPRGEARGSRNSSTISASLRSPDHRTRPAAARARVRAKRTRQTRWQSHCRRKRCSVSVPIRGRHRHLADRSRAWGQNTAARSYWSGRRPFQDSFGVPPRTQVISRKDGPKFDQTRCRRAPFRGWNGHRVAAANHSTHSACTSLRHRMRARFGLRSLTVVDSNLWWQVTGPARPLRAYA